MTTSSNLIKEVTILRTWKGETFEIDMKYEDFLNYEEGQKKLGYDGFPSKKYRRFIKFASIEDKIGKTLYLSLPLPKEQNKLYTEEEKQKSRQIKQEILKKLEPRLKLKFIETRDEILKRLAFDEKKYGFQTTIEKLEKFSKIENELKILKSKY